MEVLLVIVGIIGVIFLLGLYGINKDVARYRDAINQTIDFFDSKDYKQTEIYKVRMEALKELGWTEVSLNLLEEIRMLMITAYKVHPEFFLKKEVNDLEHLFLMKYAIVHGCVDDYQRNIALGKTISKYIN